MAEDLQTYLAEASETGGGIPAEVVGWVNDGAQADQQWAVSAGLEPRVPTWQIGDDSAASWAFRRLNAATAELARIDDQYSEELARLNAWRELAGGRHTRTAQYMTGRLEEYAIACRKAEPDHKTLLLPAGKVRTYQPSEPWRVMVSNGSVLLEWALANNREEMVRPKLATLSEIRDLVVVAEKDDHADVFDAETGERVPGLEAVANRITASVVVG